MLVLVTQRRINRSFLDSTVKNSNKSFEFARLMFGRSITCLKFFFGLMHKNIINIYIKTFILTFFVIFTVQGGLADSNNPPLGISEASVESGKKHRIVYVGNTLMSHASKYGFLEAALTTRWPAIDVTFRNLGWPGDDVFGIARSQFGSPQNTQSWQPPKDREQDYGYEVLLEQINDAQPTVIIVGYGSNAAFDKTDVGFEDFKGGYGRLLNALSDTQAKLILLTPPQQENTLLNPDVSDRNDRLAQVSDFILQQGEIRDFQVIDLFKNLRASNSGNPITENGVHLNEEGYRLFASLVAQSLDADLEWEIEMDSTGAVINTIGTSLAKLEIQEDRIRWELIDATLPPAVGPEGRVLKVHGLPPENGYRLKIDGKEVAIADGGSWGQGIVIDKGPEFDQTKILTTTVFEKNSLYYQKLRPLNETYIFLFRRYEMGHLSYEVDDLDRMTRERDEQIAYQKIPRPHRYELERVTPWSPPRDYPDHEVPDFIPDPDISEELASFTLADGFEINLFASDPAIVNPININWDTQGRLWVSTSSTYPHIKPGNIPNDRIVILEDTTGDGRADKSTVFADGLIIPQSVMPIPGGAYVCSSTEFLHLIDTDGDDFADERRVVFAGFGNADVHHMIHGLRWSPWGEIYFMQSIYINTYLETAWGQRRLNGSGFWRFRPETEELEVYTRGMVNPWGIVFDRWGQSYATDGAGGDGVYYLYPGAAFRTAVGADRILNGMNPGKPKATGAEIISGRHFPDSYKDSVIMTDFRANRVVRYQKEEYKSGYKAQEVETLIYSSHRSFRPVDLKMGPDGALYIADWYNPIIDHGEVDFHHPLRDKSHGRIWRMVAKDRPLVKKPRIPGSTNEELFDLLDSPETWTVEQVRRELASRSQEEVLNGISSWLSGLSNSDAAFDQKRLEGLWLHAAFRSENKGLLKAVLNSADHHARAAAVRLASLYYSSDPEIQNLLFNAAIDDHPQVRLEAVNALRKLNTLDAVNAAMVALDYPVDEDLDYALWLTARNLQHLWLPGLKAKKTAFESKANRLIFALGASNDPDAIEPMVELCKSGQIKGGELWKAQKIIADLGDVKSLAYLVEAATKQKDAELLQALADSQNSNIPYNSDLIVGLIVDRKAELRVEALRLAGKWRIGSATKNALRRAHERSASMNERFEAARTLIALDQINEVRSLTGSSFGVGVRIAALCALVPTDVSLATDVAAQILQSIRDTDQILFLFTEIVRHHAGPPTLTKALEGLKLKEPVAQIGINVAQSSGRDLSELIQQLQISGSLSSQNKPLSSISLKSTASEALEEGDPIRGKAIYERQELACISCHAIGGEGGLVGPDLGSIGAFMTPEGILESLISPSTTIKQGYETVLITLSNDEMVSGTLQRRTVNSALVRDVTGASRAIPLDNIKHLDTSPISLMPPGLTANLQSDELRDLVSFLRSLGKE